MQAAVLFDQYPAIYRCHGAVAAHGSQGINGGLIRVTTMNRQQDLLVGDKKVGIGGRQPLAFPVELRGGQGQGNQGQPVVLIRGVDFPDSELGANSLPRPREQDMFR